ncbi:MAG: aminotransferase class I/II-fold pyridoxal phosphate-dependent enzyme, partial [Spirochaetota bacterium]
MNTWGFETKAIHSGCDPALHQGATSIPIYETTAYTYGTAEELADVFDGKKFGHIYSRISNPTVSAFEQRMNALEEGTGAIAVSSGMAAVSTVLFSLLSQGDEIVSSSSLFGGTLLLFNKIFRKYGVKVRYVNPVELKTFREALSRKTVLIFVETIGNPKLDVPDLRSIAALAEEFKIPLIVDSTLTTPYLIKARDFGASIVLHSTTKYITGNGSTIGGVLVDTGTFDWTIGKDRELKLMAGKYGSELAFLSLARRQVVQNTGSCLSPFNAFLHCLGLETLALRMEKHCSNAQELAGFLEAHPRIKQVNYPGTKNNPHFKTANLQFQGKFGALLTFRLGSRERCFQMINHLKMVKNLANLGDAKTLIIHPASTIYHDCSKEEMEGAGVFEDM